MSNIVRAIRNVIVRPLKPLARVTLHSLGNRTIERAGVDPRIEYPCYKSFDEFIDVERLKSLDQYITDKIERHIRTHDVPFDAGFMTLKANSPRQPGSRVISLSSHKGDNRYQDLDNPDLWERDKAADEFPLLMDFISTLPFQRTARMMIMYDDTCKPVTPHRDHVATNVCHEFIWFRTNLRKPFYMLNNKTNERLYVDSYSAWFDSVNQFHGADAQDGLSVSLRVDGIFSDEFRKRIPVPA